MQTIVSRIVTAALTGLGGLPALAQESPKPDRYVLVRCGRLLDVPGKPPRADATLVVRNDKVDRVVDGFGGPDLSKERTAGATISEVDLRDSFVLPGLIDCHVHLTMEFSPDTALKAVTETASDKAMRGVVYAKRTLDAGFTTVRDLGAEAEAIFALRDAIARGDVVGPRIIAAGKSVAITGGHADPTNGYRADVFGVPGPEEGVADGPDECMKAVRAQIKRGADVIKITATGGVLSRSGAGLALHFTEDELRAIVVAAHAMGRKVAAHAHGTDGINAALRAGVDSIEHATFIDDESLRLFKEKGTWMVPTLLASATVTENARKPGYYIDVVARKALEAGPARMTNFSRSIKSGVKVAFGTDSGVSTHGLNAREFALMVQAGMSPADCIVAATINAAALCGLEREIGTIEPGKQADVIAVRGDPLTDATEFERVTFVMRGGSVVRGVAK
ncbi:MAG: amidohydrolase family protein [Phycisphaerales bacterium]